MRPTLQRCLSIFSLVIVALIQETSAGAGLPIYIQPENVFPFEAGALTRVNDRVVWKFKRIYPYVDQARLDKIDSKFYFQQTGQKKEVVQNKYENERRSEDRQFLNDLFQSVGKISVTVVNHDAMPEFEVIFPKGLDEKRIKKELDKQLTENSLYDPYLETKRIKSIEDKLKRPSMDDLDSTFQFPLRPRGALSPFFTIEIMRLSSGPKVIFTLKDSAADTRVLDSLGRDWLLKHTGYSALEIRNMYDQQALEKLFYEFKTDLPFESYNKRPGIIETGLLGKGSVSLAFDADVSPEDLQQAVDTFLEKKGWRNENHFNSICSDISSQQKELETCELALKSPEISDDMKTSIQGEQDEMNEKAKGLFHQLAQWTDILSAPLAPNHCPTIVVDSSN